MNILIISATQNEILKTIHHFKYITKNNFNIEFLETGIGQLHSCFNLTKKLQTSSYDIVIQAGICGSVSKTVLLGEVVHITEEEIIDIGATSHSGFIPLGKLEFALNSSSVQETKFIPNNSLNTNIIKNMPKGYGITSNIAHGDLFWINYLTENYPFAFESMEGATSFFVCNNFNTPVIQIRAVSNYVEIRDTSKWEIKKSIDNLNQYLIDIIHEI